MTRQEFKFRWESNDNAGGITFNDIADCFVEWGLGQSPKTQSLAEVRYTVLKAANIEDAEDYHPNFYTDLG